MQTSRPTAAETLEARRRWMQHESTVTDANCLVRVGLAASFTVEPLVPFLGSALLEVGLGPRIAVAPYNQLFQTCLAPQSTFEGDCDVAVLLWRIEDLMLEDLSSCVLGEVERATDQALEKLDELIDAIKGGKPDLLLMSRRSRRKLTSLMRALGSIEVGQDEFGNAVQLYNGIPVAINDWILDTHTVASSLETATTGGANSTIYAFQLGEGALCGLSSPEMLQVERLGSLETKDATRTRVKWYVSLALFSQVKAAALIGVKD